MYAYHETEIHLLNNLGIIQLYCAQWTIGMAMEMYLVPIKKTTKPRT
jgi:hypothetical protein